MHYCIYHDGDLDGRCAAAIIKRHDPSVLLVAHDYGRDLPESIGASDTVTMVDISLKPFVKMINLKRCTKSFTWIDHHKSAIEAYEAQKSVVIPGKREIGSAACELTWEYLYPTIRAPRGVTLLGRYDVYDLYDGVLEFQYAMQSVHSSPGCGVWNELFIDSDGFIRNMLKKGDAIRAYAEAHNERVMDAYSFEMSLTVSGKTYSCLAVNAPFADTRFFKSQYFTDLHELMLAFVVNGPEIRVSIYTTHDHIDCSSIASYFGGGGHKKAAGFTIELKDEESLSQSARWLKDAVVTKNNP